MYSIDKHGQVINTNGILVDPTDMYPDYVAFLANGNKATPTKDRLDDISEKTFEKKKKANLKKIKDATKNVGDIIYFEDLKDKEIISLVRLMAETLGFINQDGTINVSGDE